MCSIDAFGFASGTTRPLLSEKRTLRTTVCEWRVINLDASSNHVTYEPQRTIANQRTWQQAGFAQNLKPVTRPEDELASARITNDRFHDGRKTRYSAAAQVIAVSKSTGQHNCVKIVQRGLLVPDVLGVQSVEPIDRREAILIAI